MSDLEFEISERKKAEHNKVTAQNALMQSSKLAEIGALSAGVAHEFRNPISGLSNNIQIIKKRLYNSSLNKNISVAEDCLLSMECMKKYLDSGKSIFTSLLLKSLLLI